MIVRRHGHLSPHVLFVIAGDIWCGDRHCRAGTHIELPLGAAFGPLVAGDEGATLFEVMMGDPRSWGDDLGTRWPVLRAERGVTSLPDPPLRVPRMAHRPQGALGPALTATGAFRRSLDWAFVNRRTGRYTVAQWPNLALCVFIGATVLHLFHPSGTFGTVVRSLGEAALIVWAIDEVVRGVNPFRRVLGAAVGLATVLGLLLG